MNELKERSQSEYVANALTSVSAAYLKDLDKAFYHLEKAYIDRDPDLIMLKYEPWVPASLRRIHVLKTFWIKLDCPSE